MYQRQFDIYKATLSQAGVERRQAYSEWYMNATEVTGGGFFGPNRSLVELIGDVWGTSAKFSPGSGTGNHQR